MKPFSDFLDTVDDSDYSDYIEKIVEPIPQTSIVYHPLAGRVKRPCYFCTQISKGG